MEYTSPLTSSHPHPYSLSPMEATHYYYGLPSTPRLVARTGTVWKAPTGPEAYSTVRELRPVGSHALQDVWEDNLALKVHALLASKEVQWTSTDVVRIGSVGESSAPVILWIGVVPASLSGDDGFVAASECLEILKGYGITDVEVEIRESIVTLSSGPKLLTSAYTSNPTVDVRDPLTTTLGLPICAQSTPWVEGTGGFFITEGGKPERLLLVTARHVVFIPDKYKNENFEHKDESQPRHVVRLFGDAAFKKYLKSIEDEIRRNTFMAGYQKERLEAIEGEDDPESNMERNHAQAELDKANKAIERLSTFYDDVKTHWASPESRVLGHVILSPPINVGVGSEGYTEDWAVIEIDTSKIDANNFKGNAIDLGTRISPDVFTRMMWPNLQSPTSFTYPGDRLLKLKGTIPDEQLRRPTSSDQNSSESCLIVIKRGNATGLTVGRANTLCSYVHNYLGDDNAKTSKEWCILPFDSRSGPFSDKGDSGSVIVDSLGRIGGLLTGGAGSTRSDSLDITFATPIGFLLTRMQSNGLYKPNVNPALV